MDISKDITDHFKHRIIKDWQVNYPHEEVTLITHDNSKLIITVNSDGELCFIQDDKK